MLLLTDNPLRQALFRGTAKAAEKIKEGFGQATKEVESGEPPLEAGTKAAGNALAANPD